jgi:transposase
MEEVKRFVGIDVAKVALDVFIGSAGAAFSVTNDEVGIRELLRHLAPDDFVILEATGGLEMPVASALAAAGIAVAIVNSTPGARLCPCHRPTGQDRSAGCRSAGAVR